MKKITTKELKKKIDAKRGLVLVDALMPNSFKARHIPGAKNIPYDSDFMEKFKKKIKSSKTAEIVVYCASDGCQLSVMAVDALAKAGYKNAIHYADGLAGWQDAGYKFEGAAA